MSTYSHGWRRKIGVVTLVMAGVSVAGWARSHSHFDQVTFPALGGECDTQAINSVCGYLIWTAFNTHPPPFFTVGTIGFDVFSIENYLMPELSKSFREWTGIGIGSEGHTWLISYWYLTIPLIMLSAYLLLSKPRIAKTNDDAKN